MLFYFFYYGAAYNNPICNPPYQLRMTWCGDAKTYSNRGCSQLFKFINVLNNILWQSISDSGNTYHRNIVQKALRLLGNQRHPPIRCGWGNKTNNFKIMVLCRLKYIIVFFHRQVWNG